MNSDPYRQAAKKSVTKHKVLSVAYTGNSGWKRQLELELDAAVAKGWRPIFYGDAGSQATVIMEKTVEEDSQ